MSTITEHPIWKHFVRVFPSDPERLRTMADVEQTERIPHEERFPCNSVFEAIDTVCQERGDAIALTFLPSSDVLTDSPKRWTYNQYRDEVIAAANMFRSLGVKRGESVLLMCPNVPEMIFGLWGSQLVGIATPVNPDLKPKQIATISVEADATVIVAWVDKEDDSFLVKAREVQRENPAIRHIVVVGDKDACSDQGDDLVFWADRPDAPEGQTFADFGAIDGSSISAYFHTGGTTGTPKLAQHEHRAAVLNVCMMTVTGPVPDEGEEFADSVVLSGLPLFHCNAMYVSVLSTLMGGGELVLAGEHGFRNPLLFAHFWALIERYKVTFFSTVPTVYSALLSLDSSAFDTSSLICCSSGSAPISRNVLQEFRDPFVVGLANESPGAVDAVSPTMSE